MPKMIAVAPCPFCGSGEQDIETAHERMPHKFKHGMLSYVRCNCGAQGPTASTEDGAYRVWNQRIENVVRVSAEEKRKELQRRLQSISSTIS